MPDWEAEAKPVLAAIYRLSEGSEAWDLTSVKVAQALGRGHAEVARIMSYLAEAGYLMTENSIDQASGEIMVEVQQLTEKSLQQVAGWPITGTRDLSAELIAAIDARIADAAPEERGRLERLREAVAEVGKDVLAEVIAKVATHGV